MKGAEVLACCTLACPACAVQSQGDVSKQEQAREMAAMCCNESGNVFVGFALASWTLTCTACLLR